MQPSVETSHLYTKHYESPSGLGPGLESTAALGCCQLPPAHTVAYTAFHTGRAESHGSRRGPTIMDSKIRTSLTSREQSSSNPTDQFASVIADQVQLSETQRRQISFHSEMQVGPPQPWTQQVGTATSP